MAFKHILVSQFSEVPANEVIGAVSADSSFSSLCRCLSKLASIALILPVSTANCERGFSTMNRLVLEIDSKPQPLTCSFACHLRAPVWG